MYEKEIQRLSRSAEERFWSKVDTSGDCWIWTGSVAGNGYGDFGASPSRHVSAHRFSYEQAYGEIPHGVVIRHQCDTPLCVKPTHLLPGSHSDNKADSVTRHRHAHGERHGHSRFSDADIREMRRLMSLGLGSRSIARVFNTDSGTVCKIARRESWAHVA